MARVSVTHGIGDLANDLAAIPEKMVREGSRAVEKNVRAGNTMARRFNKKSAGPHGSNHFKRLTHEMTGPLEGEFGFTGDIGDSVGGGFRHGSNRDLPRAADAIGPKFEAAVDSMVDGLFW